MELSSEFSGDLLIVKVEDSRIDAAAAIQFKDGMRQITSPPSSAVVLDLSGVEFVDSSGLGAIVASMKLLGGVRPLHLSGLTPIVAKVFSLTRMERVFRIFETVEDAILFDKAKSA